MSLTFYTSNNVCKKRKEEKIVMTLMRFTPLQNGCLITIKICVRKTEKIKSC